MPESSNLLEFESFRARRNGPRGEFDLPQTAGVSVIIPAFNEEAGIAAVLRQVCSLGHGYEVIVVDDGSSDGTAEIAEAFDCRVVRHQKNCGKGTAMRTGVLSASSENIVFIDADDTYPVDAISTIARLLLRSDFVIGERVNGRENIPRLNQLGNDAIALMIRMLYGFNGTDPLSGLYGLKREAFLRMDLRSPGFAIESEIALKAARMGLRIETFPIVYKERIGDSKLSALHDGYRIGTTILSMLTLYNPILLFVIPGLLLFAGSTAVVVALFVQPISVGPLLFSTNTLLAAGMLSLAGFEIATFGTALYLYGVLHKYTRPVVIGSTLCRVFQSSWLGVIASSALLSSMSLSSVMFASWAVGGFGPFEHTATLFIGAYMGILGLQALVSALFLSPLLDDLRSAESWSILESDLPQSPVPDGIRPYREEESARAA
jgi:hypothetical protein